MFVCISDDYELGAKFSLPFGGFMSCSAGNPLAMTSRKGMLVGARLEMLRSDVLAWMCFTLELSGWKILTSHANTHFTPLLGIVNTLCIMFTKFSNYMSKFSVGCSLIIAAV